MSDPALLPQRESLNVEQKKVLEYLLNLESKDGASKAKFFLGRGFTRKAWDEFAAALKTHGSTRPVVGTRQTPFGMNYTLECDIMTPDGRNPCVLTVWTIEGEEPPRLVTAYPR